MGTMMTNDMIKIGEISATIGLDERYRTTLDVLTDGERCQLRIRECGAVGGIDGPGESFDAGTHVVDMLPARAGLLARAIRNAVAGNLVLAEYGKLKDFEWRIGLRDIRADGQPMRGVSATKCRLALEAASQL